MNAEVNEEKTAEDDVERIYQGAFLSIKANIPDEDLESVKEITFKFCKDGEQFEEKVIVPAQAEQDDCDDDAPDGQTVISYRLKAPDVPDNKDSYLLDYHLFYKVENKDGSVDDLQELSVERFLVFPRTAQLKVIWDKDDKAFPGFQFNVFQNGEQIGKTQHTFAHDTQNAKGETIPTGSAEFNLDLTAGFNIVQVTPYEIVTEVKNEGRKREIKGDFKFRATINSPVDKNIKQYVNYDVENKGKDGIGHEVEMEIGVNVDDLKSLELLGDGKKEIFFRVSYGPDEGELTEKSKRKDDKFPTKALKADGWDDVTIDEKKANEKYEGTIELKNNIGVFKVGLGKAGGDVCKVEVSGSDKFLTEKDFAADKTICFENWRKVHLEMMAPEIMAADVFDSVGSGDNKVDDNEESFNKSKDNDKAESDDKQEKPLSTKRTKQGESDSEDKPLVAGDLSKPIRKMLEKTGKQLFIEFIPEKNHVFSISPDQDETVLAPAKFLDQANSKKDVDNVYILSGFNWRDLPEKMAWDEKNLGKTLYVRPCHSLLKWRKDTDDEQKGTNDFSGTLTEAVASINIQDKFGGHYMPFSGSDGTDGITGFKWTADISKDDKFCSYTAELTIEDGKSDDVPLNELYIDLVAGDNEITIEFMRPAYPEIEVVDKAKEITADGDDDGKVIIKEVNLGKELSLSIALPADSEIDDDDGESSLVSSGDASKLDDFLKDLFESGKDTLATDDDSNVFKIEIHTNTGTHLSDNRFVDVENAIDEAYEKSYDHDQHKFVIDEDGNYDTAIKDFIDLLLADTGELFEVEGKVLLTVNAPADDKHGEADCLQLVKDKIQKYFDEAGNKTYTYHPGLTDDGEPREGTFSLQELTNGEKCTVDEWHFILPEITANRELGPGAFVGEEKNSESCPIKIDFSVQAHEKSTGEVDGKSIAWVLENAKDRKLLPRLILTAYDEVEDKAAEKHGHGDDGKPGDCLLESDELCQKCVDYGRSKDLTKI